MQALTCTLSPLEHTVSEVTVFYTVWGDETVRTETALALESAKGLIRSAVGRATGLKHTPSLAFLHDAVPENAFGWRRLALAERSKTH